MEMLLLCVILLGLLAIAGLLDRLQKFEALVDVCCAADLRKAQDVILVQETARAVKEMRI